MAHAMGAVAVGAPHRCPDGSAHTCDAGSDLMHGLSVSYPSLREVILDVNRDDYYRHGGPWFDLSTSPWLRHLDVPLQQLSLSVTGTGTVDASQPGGTCAATCSTTWESGTQLTLTAVPADGQRFVGWSGPCSGDAFECQVTLDRAQQVSAAFGPASVKLSLRLRGAGSVRVVEEGATCRKTCALDVAAGVRLVLTAKPAKGWRFVGFSGACTGKRLRCAGGTIAAPLTETAVFKRR
jgi:hypothetical protein